MVLPFRGQYRLTQPFGVNLDAYRKYGMDGHNGQDYALPNGTQLIAPISGHIYSGYEADGYGNYVFIRVPNMEIVLAHLSRVDRMSGFISQGDPIGLSGNTGNSSGPHLHFGVRPLPRINNGFLGYVDPARYLTGDEEMIPNSDQVQALFRAFRGRAATDAEVKKYVGTPYAALVAELDGGPERDQVVAALKTGRLAIKDRWDAQIGGLVADKERMTAKIADLVRLINVGKVIDILEKGGDNK